jgi:small-conductance mechanosensitive channel
MIRGGRAVEQAVRSSGVEKAASEIISRVVFWTVLAFFAVLACEALGLSVASAGLRLLARYLPTVVGAVLLFLAGLVLGNLARDAVATVSASMGIVGNVPGQVARWTVIVVATIVALDQIGIDSTLLILAVGIVLAAIVGSAALAVGLGTRTEVGNLVAVHYVARSYSVGQTIRIGETEGRIVEFRTNGVVIATREGRVLVPGREFSERESRLIVEGVE